MQEIVVSTGWRERIEGLLGRRRDVGIVAGIAVVLVILSLALWARGTPAAAVAPPATVSPTPSSGASVPPPGSLIYVHVAGAVRNPGLYELPAGLRAADAIGAAGGATRGADLDAINLAEVLVDGIQLLVPTRGESASEPVPGSTPSAATPVDLNTADQTLLETIPGIGPVTATAILQHRDQIGGFQSIEELLDVDGIGPATLESLRPYVTI
ncbi:MAG: ComEA family DNA-binding protein [Actinomycetota bacterium]